MPSDKDIKPTAAVKPTAAQLITYWAEQNRLLKDEVASLKALLSDASAAKFKELSDHMKSLQAQVEGSGYMDVWAVLHKEQDAKAAQCQELKDKVKTLTAEVEAWVNQEIWVNHGNNTFTVKREPGDALRRRVNLSRLSPLEPLRSPRVEEIWINHRTNTFTVKGEPGELSDTAALAPAPKVSASKAPTASASKAPNAHMENMQRKMEEMQRELAGALQNKASTMEGKRPRT